jgi:hypothetical protein
MSQPLTIVELTTAADALRQAEALVARVRGIFLTAGDYATAARVNDIIGRLADEVAAIERAIQAAKP